jgi:hypothetical protein
MASDNDFDDVMLAIRNGKYNHNNFFHNEKKTYIKNYYTDEIKKIMDSDDVKLKPVKKSVSFDLNVIYIEHKNGEDDPSEPIPFTLNQFPGKYLITDSEKLVVIKANKIENQNTFDMVDEWSNITNQAIDKRYKYIYIE